MTQIPIVTTARLTLRPLKPADAVALHRIYQTDGVLRYFPNPTPPAIGKVERFILEQQAHWEAYGYGNWGIVPGEEEEIIGWVGLQFVPELDEVEVGYLLAKPFWGKGYAAEAARASLQFGFDVFAFARLIALVHSDNIASQRVLEKCSMKYVETLHLWGIDLMQYQKKKRH